MEKKTELRIDAVKEVRRIRDAHHDALVGQPWEARAAFYRERAAKLNASLRKARESDARGSAA